MKIYEIIGETTLSGWQEEPERYFIPGGGEIIIGFRKKDTGEIDGAIFNYYDIRINTKEPVFSVRIQNKHIYEYDHLLSRNGKLLEIDLSIETVKEYFLNGVAKYLNSFLKEK